MKKNTFYHALKVVATQCTGCTHCMNVCPTSAIRIRHGKASINEAACTDCGMCLKSCPRHAIIVAQDDFNRIYDFPFRVIMLPTVFIGQFSEDISEEQIFSALHQLGFNYVIEVDKATGLLMEETKRYMERHPEQRPFISNFCPAVIRLIQVRFPSLIPHIIRLKQAMDITATYVRKKYIDRGIPGEDIGIFYVTQCAAKIAAIKCPVGEEKSSVDGVINMDFIYNKVLLSLKQHRDKPLETVPEQYHLPPQSILWTQSGGEAANYKGRCLAIDEIHNVIDILEKIENDELKDIDFLELRACDHSCSGGALTINNRFLTIERLQKRKEQYITQHLTSVNKMPQYAGGHSAPPHRETGREYDSRPPEDGENLAHDEGPAPSGLRGLRGAQLPGAGTGHRAGQGKTEPMRLPAKGHGMRRLAHAGRIHRTRCRDLGK